MLGAHLFVQLNYVSASKAEQKIAEYWLLAFYIK